MSEYTPTLFKKLLKQSLNRSEKQTQEHLKELANQQVQMMDTLQGKLLQVKDICLAEISQTMQELHQF